MIDRKEIVPTLIAIAPRVAGETVLAIVLSDALTAIATWSYMGSDANTTLSAPEFWKIAMVISTIVAAVVTPIFAAVMAVTLRQLQEARISSTTSRRGIL